MVSAANNSAGSEVKEVKDIAQQFLVMNKARYEKLWQYNLTGKIDQTDFESRLEDEKKMLEAQLNTLAIKMKVIAKKCIQCSNG